MNIPLKSCTGGRDDMSKECGGREKVAAIVIEEETPCYKNKLQDSQSEKLTSREAHKLFKLTSCQIDNVANRQITR